MENRNDKSKNIIIVLLIIMIVGLAGFICYDQFIVKKESEKPATSTTNNNQQNNVVEQKTEEKVVYSPKKVIFNSNGIATVNLGDNQVTLSNKMNDDQGELKFNDKVLKKLDFINIVDEVYTMNDILLVVISGSDIRSSVLYIYDKNGNKLREIYELDNSNKGMVIRQSDSSNNDEIKYLSFNNNKIIIEGWRINHESTIVVNGKEVKYCNKSQLNANNITDSFIVRAKYEIEYLGSNTFGQLKMVEGSQTTFGNENLTKNCNQ